MKLTFDYLENVPNIAATAEDKAVGWLLREMGKQCGMDGLRAFLKEHASVMPRTALRYAIEKMEKDEREYWMKMK